MQQEKDHGSAADPSQGSGQGSSSSVLLHSSKLRNKLEKLAQWRIDPSLIDFPENAREFRGGYATVSKAFLASSSSAEGSEDESEHTTDEHPDSDTRSLQSQSDTQDLEGDQQGRDEGVDSRTGAGDKHDAEEDRRKASDGHEQSTHPTPIPKVGEESESFEHSARGDPVSGDRNVQSQRDTQKPGDDNHGKDEGMDGRTVDGDDQIKVEGKEKSNNHEEQKSHPQSSISTTGDDSASSEHNTDNHAGSSNVESNAQEPEDDQGGKNESSGSPVTDVENDQAKDEQNSGRQSSKPKQIVAVKMLKIERDTDLERVLGLALRESEFLVKLSHPNIVKLEGFVEDLSAQKVWLIFPWEEYGNLRDYLASGEWEVPERISLIHDVTLGLEYLHSREPPVYHGDLKSLNILVSSKCRALITDFGSARHLGSDHVGKQAKENDQKPQPTTDPNAGEEPITLEAIFSATASTLTLTGSGYTLRWAAPELLQDDKPCLRSDIWAFGWIAYEVMTNTIPFHDVKKNAIVIHHIIQGHLPSVTEDARMSLIRALCSVMVRCWSINPDKRPTAEECRKLISWMPMIIPAPNQAIDEEVSQLRHAELLNKLGNMHRRQADYPSALSSFTKALDIYTNHNDNNGQAETLRYLGDVHRFQNEDTEAIKFYLEALQINADSDDESERALTLFGLASSHRSLEEYGEAIKLYSECLQIYTNIDSKRGRATALWGLAEVHRFQAEYSKAIDLYSEALKIYTDVGDVREKGLTLWSLAEVYCSQKQYSEAINLYSEALQIETDVGNHTDRAYTLWSLAQVHRFQHKYSEASKLYSEALQVTTEIGDRPGRGTALWGLAEVHLAVQEYDEATKLYSEAMPIFTDVGDKYWRAETLVSLAETNQKQGHSGEAISLYTEASEVWEEMGDAKRASDALENAADIRKTLQAATTDSAETVKVGEDPLPTSG